MDYIIIYVIALISAVVVAGFVSSTICIFHLKHIDKIQDEYLEDIKKITFECLDGVNKDIK